MKTEMSGSRKIHFNVSDTYYYNIMTLDQLNEQCKGSGDTLESKVHAILSRRFVRYEKVARVLTLALLSNQNVILWGPAGHGKSEMVEEVLKGLGLWDCDPISGLPTPNSSTFVQSFGEGMTEDQLWGGIDLRAMEEDKVIKYHPENSFLNKEIAVFEEMFDAPAICLLPLKHTLTQKFLAKGGAHYPMKTKSIIVCTNKNPEDLQAMGPSHQALVERFTIQLRVEWDSYHPDSYVDMLYMNPNRHMFSDETIAALADTISKVTLGGTFISPRSAMWAMNLVAANARAHGRTHAHLHDFMSMEFLPGLEGSVKEMKKNMERETKVAAARKVINELQKQLEELGASYEEFMHKGSSPIQWLKLSKYYEAMSATLANSVCTDTLMTIRDQMLQVSTERDKLCVQHARTTTKI